MTAAAVRPGPGTPLARAAADVRWSRVDQSPSTVLLAEASTGVAPVLRGPLRRARVVDREPTAVYLTVRHPHGSDVVAVLTAGRGQLALGCRLSQATGDGGLLAVPVGSPACVGRGHVCIGELTIRAASWWDPRPRLPCAHPVVIPEAVDQLRRAVFGAGRSRRTISLPGVPEGRGGPLAALRGAVRRSDFDAALRAVTRLLGQGRGPAPAGDAVLAGTTAGLVLLGHPGAGRLVDRVVARAGGGTTELSAALLHQATAGRVGGELAAVLRGVVGIGPVAPAIKALVDDGPTNGRAQALGLYTAISLIHRT